MNVTSLNDGRREEIMRIMAGEKPGPDGPLLRSALPLALIMVLIFGAIWWWWL